MSFHEKNVNVMQKNQIQIKNPFLEFDIFKAEEPTTWIHAMGTNINVLGQSSIINHWICNFFFTTLRPRNPVKI